MEVGSHALPHPGIRVSAFSTIEPISLGVGRVNVALGDVYVPVWDEE
jgi:hypothetical protein